jgi:hypothetical protein
MINFIFIFKNKDGGARALYFILSKTDIVGAKRPLTPNS